jgi:hypothetical protein
VEVRRLRLPDVLFSTFGLIFCQQRLCRKSLEGNGDGSDGEARRLSQFRHWFDSIFWIPQI